MTIQKHYIIEKKMILLMGEYDRYGKLCSRIMAGQSAFLVDRTPLQLVDDSLVYIGFDLRGAMSSAKLMLDKKVKCPVIVNPYLDICLFPIQSPNRAECMWFNPDHIVKTTPIGSMTKVGLSNGYSLVVNSRLSAFNGKIETANQLVRLSRDRGNHPDTIILYPEPKEELQLAQEKSGKFNFDALEKKVTEKM